MSYPQSYEDYNRAGDPPPSKRGIIGSLMTAGIILLFALALAGCYGSPIDTRAIDADKVTIVHSTPWTTLTIQAEGWHSTVKTATADGAPKTISESK
jgi:hypothetical protein